LLSSSTVGLLQYCSTLIKIPKFGTKVVGSRFILETT
jgi:hypothetical protein